MTSDDRLEVTSVADLSDEERGLVDGWVSKIKQERGEIDLRDQYAARLGPVEIGPASPSSGGGGGRPVAFEPAGRTEAIFNRDQVSVPPKTEVASPTGELALPGRPPLQRLGPEAVPPQIELTPETEDVDRPSKRSFYLVSAAALLFGLIAISQATFASATPASTFGAAGPAQADPALESAVWNAERDGDGFPVIDATWTSQSDTERLGLTQEGADCVHLGTVVTPLPGGLARASMTVGVPGASNLVLVETDEPFGCVASDNVEVVTWLGHIDLVVEGDIPTTKSS